MQPEKVDEMLDNYCKYAARVAYLTEAIREAERLCESLRKTVVEDTVSITQVISDMPHGTALSDPTGRIGMMLAEGYVPEHIRQVEEDLSEMRLEVQSKQIVLTFVDAWLVCLSPRERFVIEKHKLCKEFWRDVAEGFAKEFGDQYSTQGLKRIQKRALKKM